MMSGVRQYFQTNIVLCLIFGITSGLPLAAAGGTLQAWMKNLGVDIATIGLFALVGLPYSYKFLWAPIVDHFQLFSVGRRKSWMYASQSGLVLIFIGISYLNPTSNLSLLAAFAVVASFLSATQDIVLDAYRRDILPDSLLGLGSSVFVAGYRIGLLIGGAFSLWITQFASWNQIYLMFSCFMLLGILATTFAPEPIIIGQRPRTLARSIIEPLKNFLHRAYAMEILLFVLCYKLGDVLAASMSSIFILDIGFTNAQLGMVGKTYGLCSAILGGILGGSFIPRLGINKSLWIFGLIQAIGILAFTLLANNRANHSFLIFSVIIENLTSGMGTAAFLAFLGIICDKRFSATQYALLTSIMSLPRTMLAAGMGIMAKSLGWPMYFIFCATMAIPGLLLLIRVNKWETEIIHQNSSDSTI